MEKHYNLKQVAELLNVHRNQIYAACWGGKLKYVRIGRSMRIAESSIQAFLGKK